MCALTTEIGIINVYHAHKILRYCLYWTGKAKFGDHIRKGKTTSSTWSSDAFFEYGKFEIESINFFSLWNCHHYFNIPYILCTESLYLKPCSLLLQLIEVSLSLSFSVCTALRVSFTMHCKIVAIKFSLSKLKHVLLAWKTWRKRSTKNVSTSLNRKIMVTFNASNTKNQ